MLTLNCENVRFYVAMIMMLAKQVMRAARMISVVTVWHLLRAAK